MFTANEKEQIRYHMGYLQVGPAASISYGIPAPIQTLFLLESAMDRLINTAAEDRVRRLITVLDQIECRELDALDRLKVDQVDNVTIRKTETDELEKEYCRWASKLADTLGAPLYPGSTKFRWLFGGGVGQAGSIPVRG